jgi:hypothetical protein
MGGRSAVVVFNVSGPSLRPAARAAVHRAAGPLGSTGLSITLATSGANYDDFSCHDPVEPGICRWGDYAGASPDPEVANVVWGTQEYVGPRHHWRTRNFAVQALPGGPTARLEALPNPAVVGREVSFDASGTTDPEARIVDYAWDLNGKSGFELHTGSRPTAARTYRKARTLVTRVRTTDAQGASSIAAVTLRVNPAPVRPGPSAECRAAIKKRKLLAHSVHNLERHVQQSSGDKRREYQRKLKKRRKQYRRAKRAESEACATSAR